MARDEMFVIIQKSDCYTFDEIIWDNSPGMNDGVNIQNKEKKNNNENLSL